MNTEIKACCVERSEELCGLLMTQWDGSYHSDPFYAGHEAQELRRAQCASFNFSELEDTVALAPPVLQ